MMWTTPQAPLGALWLMTLGCIRDDEAKHLAYLTTLGLTGEKTMATQALEQLAQVEQDTPGRVASRIVREGLERAQG